MKKTYSTKRSLIASILVLCLCLTSFVGTTYAWFTDSVTSANNIIMSGNLDVEMYWADGTEAVPSDSGWTDASTGAIFDYNNWEPGYVEVRHIKIANEGSLALKYKINIVANGIVSELADVIDVYYVDPAVQIADRNALTDAMKIGTLTEVLANLGASGNGTLLAGEADTITLALKMQEGAGNEYMNLSIGSSFSIQLVATQLASEEDSFGPDYDADVKYPANIAVVVPVEKNSDGETTKDVTLSFSDDKSTVSSATAIVPAGAKLEDGATSVTFTITEKETVQAGITVPAEQKAVTYEIDVKGLADDNDAPVEVTMTLAKDLTTVILYHETTIIPSTYDPATGILTFSSADFSPFTVVYDDETGFFADGIGTAEDPYIIETAEQFDNISKYYSAYNYYKVGVEELDLSGVANVKLNGSFDGNGAKIVGLTTALFNTVGTISKAQNVKISNIDVTVNITNGNAAIVRNIFNPGSTTFENVAVHGYIEGQYNLGSFYNYGTANADGKGESYTVNFVNAKSDVTLVCTTGNPIGGMFGHGYEGAGNTLTINMDSESGYSGKMYTNASSCHKIMAMCSNATFVLNGEVVNRYAAEYKYEFSKITVSAPVAGENGYYVTPAEGATNFKVSLNAQLTAYGADGEKIANKAGLTWNLDNLSIAATDGKVFDLINNAIIVNGSDYEFGYELKDGKLTIYSNRNYNFADGNITVQVNQYDANGNLVAVGISTVHTIKTVSNVEELTEAFAKGGSYTLINDITLDADNTLTLANGKTLVLSLGGHTITAVSDETGKNRNVFDAKGGNLTVENGKISYKHVGANMGWNSSTNVFNVTAGGVLNIKNAEIENLGGSDMAFVAHLNNWGEVTLNVENSKLSSTYIAVRVFNSGYDMNNVTIEKSTLAGKYSFWVHNYISEGFDDKYLNFDIYGNGNKFEYTSKAPIIYGFNNTLYYNENGAEIVSTIEELEAALENGGSYALANNIELNKAITVKGTVKLDLNGKTISGSCNEGQGYLFMVNNGAKFTILDSSENKSGKISFAQGTSNVGWAIDLEGELVLESGTIELTGDSWSIGYAVDARPNAWGSNYKYPTVFTMNGGKIISSDGAIRVASSSSESYTGISSKFVMNGGVIEAAWDGIFIQQSNAAYDILTVELNGGKIASALSPVRVYGPVATSVVGGAEKPMTIKISAAAELSVIGEIDTTRTWYKNGVVVLGGGMTIEALEQYSTIEIAD